MTRFVACIVGCLSLAVALSVATAAVAAEQDTPSVRPEISLTLIPPSPVTDQIVLDVRGAVWNRTSAACKYDMAVFLDNEKPTSLLHQATIQAMANAPVGFKFRWPTKQHAGKHRIILTATSQGKTLRFERPIEIVASQVRSTQRLGGAWVDICHFDEGEGHPFSPDLAKMTEPQWRELVRAMHEVDQDLLVITMMFENFTHRGKHKIDTEGYHGKAYYDSKLFPGRMKIATSDPVEVIMSEADKLGMHVMPGVGCYAFFDYTPGSLRWCKQVAAELWDRYGHHPSFYGFYMSHEKDGGLGDGDAERQEIVDFFQNFTPFAHRMAPDKVVMLAPNCWHVRGVEKYYKRLLPNLDILCPFGYHRMAPEDPMTGEQAAALMQSLCDEAGCHLWMDLESFVFRKGKYPNELVPRPIDGLVSDFRRFPSFEKTLHYQFPGMMSSPKMSRQPGGPASVKLFLDYQKYLERTRR